MTLRHDVLNGFQKTHTASKREPQQQQGAKESYFPLREGGLRGPSPTIVKALQLT